jgi:hypothetical protein
MDTAIIRPAMRQSRLHAFEARAQFRGVKIAEKKSGYSAHRLVTEGHALWALLAGSVW